MEHRFLHTFRLTVDGLPDPIEFRMFLEVDDTAEATDAFAKYVARQEDDFLPLGETGAVRANRVLRIDHVRMEEGPAN
jgi:hypothetical protein